jgi:hypothetical protein
LGPSFFGLPKNLYRKSPLFTPAVIPQVNLQVEVETSIKTAKCGVKEKKIEITGS